MARQASLVSGGHKGGPSLLLHSQFTPECFAPVAPHPIVRSHRCRWALHARDKDQSLITYLHFIGECARMYLSVSDVTDALDRERHHCSKEVGYAEYPG